jgi:hypothetical protein
MLETTHHRICPLCEACCGLEITVDAGRITSIRGHEADVLSGGYICPKAIALKDLHDDPDRLRTPLIKRNGTFEPATWAAGLCRNRPAPAPADRRAWPQRHRRGRRQPVVPQDRADQLLW